MAKHTNLDDAYRDERRRVRALSDDGLAKRKAQLEEIIEHATRDLIETLNKSVVCGAMTAQEAADEFAAFTRDLKRVKGPSEPN